VGIAASPRHRQDAFSVQGLLQSSRASLKELALLEYPVDLSSLLRRMPLVAMRRGSLLPAFLPPPRACTANG
jgi:hypothetical protein